MRTTKVVWNKVSPRPDAAGHWLIWSKANGVRYTTIHPDWWNGQDPNGLGKIEAYAYLGEMTMGQDAAALLAAPKKKKRSPQNGRTEHG